MIEVVHIINRFGRQLKFCLETEDDLSSCEPETIFYIQEYALGNAQPSYPMPAIRQGFEFGQRLNGLLGGEVVLMHWVQERYDDL